jgi:hypothetical protein
VNVEFCANDIYPATKSDTAPNAGCGLIFTGGDCAVITDTGNTRVLPEALFAGIPVTCRISKVLSTGTTATDIWVYR